MFSGKIQEGFTLTHILDSIRESEMSSDPLQRLCPVEHQDLNNIARDFNINYATKRNKNDVISGKLWVTEMNNYKEDCPVYITKVEVIMILTWTVKILF